MSSSNLLKFGVPVSRQTGTKVPVRLQTGQCGIEPLKQQRPPPPPRLEKFPDHLLRPPCMPGGQRGRFPPDCNRLQAFYCPSLRPRYQFPPFSENIDFVPSGQVECWWAKAPSCTADEDDEELPIQLP